jgi:serine/threonine-protein kinase
VAAIDDVLAGRPLSDAPATVAVPAAATGSMALAGDSRPQRSRRSPAARRSPAGRARRRVATVLLPLLALLAGAGIAAALLQALSSEQPSATASAAEQESGSIVLDADNYVGRPVDVVAQRLTALGLDVELREEVTADAVPDRVTGVEPDGQPLSAGDTVVVTYAVAPPEGGSSPGSDGSGATAAVVDDAQPTEAVPTPAGDPATTSALPDTAEPTGTTSAGGSGRDGGRPGGSAPTEDSADESTPTSESSSSAPASTPTDSSTAPSTSEATAP